MKMKTLWRALPLTAALMTAAPALAAEPAPAAAAPVPAVTAADRVLGRADAPVTVIEYASFTCSHCADWTNDVLPTFKARYIDTGKVRLVFRDLPTQPAQVAATAAAIGRCAAPGKFFEVAQHFMAGQAAAFASGDARDWYMGAIAVSGRTQPQIEACLADPATQQTMQRDVEGAIAAGVEGTPSFFVNGKRVADHSIETLSAAIDPLLKGR
ncbi:protein-disulfide isomerase [Brevundimonas bullata]|jgi:protein-disulfide isomerase|uniref:Protein-disulfide isomerase n=1 Tax=Brevundimonas bullata TaxID=13160 RepID=A0A7W7N4S3_9CAUL|nr:DsbA family protein [Brevundimonas bullata]MBB4798634.1 protein-disulfide isomerase [Brevundimonas bullata]MBB6383051.1 protein-disulfide isomerase [Brevundimonas bullata]